MADQLNIVSDISLLKSREKVTLKCLNCNNLFWKPKNKVQAYIKNYSTPQIYDYDYRYCSQKCRSIHLGYKIETICFQCKKTISKTKSEYIKSDKHFCSHSCNAIYGNANKTYGYTRSKLEKWLETKLTELYPNIQIIYNDTSAIKAELDIYIPSLKIAFELNGPFHYEPIYGLEKLSKTQKKDRQKLLSCAENGIEFCVIDTSKQRYFKEKHCQPYLDIIINIIDKLINGNI